MTLEQISVFLENKAGRMAEVTGTLTEAQVNIMALSLADTSEFGILRLIVDKNEDAKEALKKRGFTVTRTNVVAVGIRHTPGGLHHILKILGEQNINVEYMYGFPYQKEDAVMVFRLDRAEDAVEVLKEHNIRIFDGSEIQG